ncbi:MAG: helix-turn-helix transcriptional regulator [Phycisphaerae bacterium]|jgi:DNA-binding XRE family transcriptional regulator
MPSATYDKAEVQARRSLIPQSEALGINLDALPLDVRKRFLELFNTFVVAASEEEREELRTALVELLDPEGKIITRTISVDDWGGESTVVEKLEEKKSRFAARVEQRMRELRLCQTDLAELMQVTPSNISQIISGKYKPQPRTLLRLAEALQTTVDDLWPDREAL